MLDESDQALCVNGDGFRVEGTSPKYVSERRERAEGGTGETGRGTSDPVPEIRVDVPQLGDNANVRATIEDVSDVEVFPTTGLIAFG
jgi:hypothetical protein